MKNFCKNFNCAVVLLLVILLANTTFFNAVLFSGVSKSIAFAETISVSTEDQFLKALSDAKDGDIIDLGGTSIQLSAPDDGRDPIVNNANITIQNGVLSLRPAGIVQGADLTLKDLTLTFQNSIRNGIFANGFNTTIENVNKSDTSAYSIHVVMGPIINPQSSLIPSKSTNSSPKLTIRGENSLGQIFMGALDDIADDAGTAGFYNVYHPTVTIETACKSVFASGENNPIYACGVSEKSATSIMDLEKTGDVMIPNSNRLRVNSTTAAINLGGSQVKSVYGDTGTGKKITVNYYGGEYLTENVVLDCVSEINIKTGSFKVANNTLSTGLILTGASNQTAIGVDSGATLLAGNLGDVAVNTFRGGGTLALGTGSAQDTLKQTLSIASSVTGTTNIVFGDMNNFWKTGVADYAYIKAPSSFLTSFEVNNATCVPVGKIWNRNEEGEWSFTTEKTEHFAQMGYVSISDAEHAYQCLDANCPYEDKERQFIEDHWFDDEDDIFCEACGYEKTVIHDIFTPQDSSALEQFKAKVFNALIKKETTITVSDIDISPEDVIFDTSYGTINGQAALTLIVRTHPLFSTLCVGTSGFVFNVENGKIASVEVTYLDLTWKIEDLRKFIKAYDECMTKLESAISDFQKVAVLHDYVCEHVSYSLNADKADFALGAIANGKAVCGGYSQGFQFLCQQAGLKCNYVTGTTTSGTHAWNKVRIDDQWFLVDTTWDRGLLTSDTFSHDYFLCNDEEFESAGDGGHKSDSNVSNNDPKNTEWYFKNKFWESVKGPLSQSLLSQDPQMTKKEVDPDCKGNHTWDSGEIVKDSTCEEAGEITYTCSVCGETKKEEISALGHDFKTKIINATCENEGSKTISCSRCGHVQSIQTIKATGHAWNLGVVTKKSSRTGFGEKTYTCSLCGKTKTEQVAKIEALTMHRLYNKWTGEHFYTSSTQEKTKLVEIGWSDEGIGWYAPKESSVPVYRLYNKYVEGGDHHYTMSTSERDSLKKAGWNYEGVGWYSDVDEGVCLYRQYNPFAEVGTHNYTTNKNENDELVKAGWREEGISWYGLE